MMKLDTFNLKENILQLIIFGLVGWFMISSITFTIRHPWVTNIEHMMHITDSLLFKKISYKEFRKNYQ